MINMGTSPLLLCKAQSEPLISVRLMAVIKKYIYFIDDNCRKINGSNRVLDTT